MSFYKNGHRILHFGPEINEAIAWSERDGGIFTCDVPENSVVLVKTHNDTLYTLTNHGAQWSIQGGPNFQEMTPVQVNEFIGIGMRFEFCAQDAMWASPPIKSIKVVPPNEDDQTAKEAIG